MSKKTLFISAAALFIFIAVAVNVTEAGRGLIRRMIARVNRESGVTILLVSHDFSVVSQHADEVICLKDGVIQCHGPPKEILTHEMLTQTFGVDVGVFAHHHAH